MCLVGSHLQLSILFMLCVLNIQLYSEEVLSGSSLLNVQNACCTRMAISFIRFVEFSAVYLLNVLSKLLAWNTPLLFHASKICSFDSISQLFCSVCSYLLFYCCCCIDVHILLPWLQDLLFLNFIQCIDRTFHWIFYFLTKLFIYKISIFPSISVC